MLSPGLLIIVSLEGFFAITNFITIIATIWRERLIMDFGFFFPFQWKWRLVLLLKVSLLINLLLSSFSYCKYWEIQCEIYTVMNMLVIYCKILSYFCFYLSIFIIRTSCPFPIRFSKLSLLLNNQVSEMTYWCKKKHNDIFIKNQQMGSYCMLLVRTDLLLSIERGK